ncbi:MAG TPA: hypothetical protein VJH97_01120 [Candidatus Nanoarchaeia archaeon]|nr:hypothetical protein [Candidatus Nanoarchaeia archaeon]
MVKTSLIRRITKDSIDKILLLNKYLTSDDSHMLREEFNITSNELTHALAGHRDLGLVFNLQQEHETLSFDWSPFMHRVILKNDVVSKLDNVFINESCSKVLLLTTKRLLKVDIKKLNEKIDLVNEAISRYNHHIERERREIEHELLPKDL